MTDRKKVDIAIFECSEENEVENLRQVVICPPFHQVNFDGTEDSLLFGVRTIVVFPSAASIRPARLITFWSGCNESSS